MNLHGQHDLDDLTVTVSELLVATADSTDPLVDDSVSQVLGTLRQRLGMDVVFVSEIVDGQRVFRFVDSGAAASPVQPGGASPVEETFCQRIVDGRLPQLIPDVAALPPGTNLPATDIRVGAHLSTPIVLKSGRIYGTLCCFSGAPHPQLRQKDLDTLKLCAQLVARKLDLAEARGIRELAPGWSLEPMNAGYTSQVWHLP